MNDPLDRLVARPWKPSRADGALAPAALAELLADLGHGWRIDEAGHLAKRFPHPDFAAALAQAVRLGALADALDHHPELVVAWGRLDVAVWTHVAGGLTETDFLWAARAERA